MLITGSVSAQETAVEKALADALNDPTTDPGNLVQIYLATDLGLFSVPVQPLVEAVNAKPVSGKSPPYSSS